MLGHLHLGQLPLQLGLPALPTCSTEGTAGWRPHSAASSKPCGRSVVARSRHIAVCATGTSSLAPAELLTCPTRSLQDYGNNFVCSSPISGAVSRESLGSADAPTASGKSNARAQVVSRSLSSGSVSGLSDISSAEAARRQKISVSMQQRWQCQTKNLRSTLQTKMKGKVPWNKGRQMSEETRQRMRAAKLASRHTSVTRSRMSRSHTGLPQTAAKGAACSTALLHVPKSQRHKEAIATAQRRRLAAHRVLQAIESVHRHCDVTALAGVVSTARTSSAPLPGLAHAARKQSRTQVLEHFQALLHEFRSLQHELGPWTTAFQEQHKRRPRMTDVEQTGIPWLENKYKQYIVMRERVLTETQMLRERLLNAVPDLQQPQHKGEIPSVGEKTNANKVAPSPSLTANRLASALAYKSAKVMQSATPAPASLLPPTSSTPAGVPSPTFSQPPRVRTALMAAAEYRRRKAEETAAAAQSAADKARVAPARPRARPPLSVHNAPGAAMLIKGMKFEGREAGQARKEVQATSDIETEAVEQLAAELDATVREMVQAELPLASSAA